MTPAPDRPAGLDVPELLDAATAASGLSAWGDMGFATTLQRLVESCRATAGLTGDGWGLLRKVALRHLRNRLYVEAFVSAHPEVATSVVEPATIITGLPRTGTTLLHNLLALDPGNRVLRFWEALHPVPDDPGLPPGAGSRPRANIERPGDEQPDHAKLLAQAQTWLDRLYSLTPEFRSIHSLTAEGPEECDALLQNSFASQHFDDMFQAESYSAWLNRDDLTDEYAYYARQLRILTGSAGGRRWVLKSPGHLGYLETLVGALPVRLIVHCHRDPVEALASYASLVMAVRSPHTERISPAEVGRHVVNRCSIAMERALQARDSLGEERFADVSYAALVSDPMSVVRTLYDRLDQTVSAEVEQAMTEWLRQNPQHKHGRHRYTLATFGLSTAQVNRSLGDYGQRFEAQLVP